MWFATPLSRARRGRDHERGTTLIEFALVFPALVAVLFGMIDGGRFIGARVMLSQAAGVAARTACLGSTTSQADVNAAVTASATMLTGVSVNWSTPATPGGPGFDCLPAGCNNTTWPQPVNTTLFMTTEYNFQAGFFRAFSKKMTQQSRMVCE
jgi:Flp pilus assembly protein TadG